jgi:hypothetical protein
MASMPVRWWRFSNTKAPMGPKQLFHWAWMSAPAMGRA